jgi:hypothetical protein
MSDLDHHRHELQAS